MTRSDLIRPFIMCGGSGQRLWPVSRASMPKQFHALTGERTLLQEAAERVRAPGFAPPVFLAGEEHRFIVADQIDAVALPRGAIVLEPVGRNTAAIALVAALMSEGEGDGLVLLMPADHRVENAAEFQEMVEEAAPAARQGAICLFGIAPTRPETGYGYIEIGPDPVGGAGSLVRSVRRFVEKPDAATATAMLASGGFAWNAGIFLYRASTLIAEAAERQPELLARCREAVAGAIADGGFLRLEPTAFAAAPSISIDYALIEGSRRTAVLPTAIAWSDLGAWDAVFAAHEPDGNGNVILGRAIGHNTTGTFVRAGRQLVATVGVSDLLVIATEDAVLVADRAQAQDVKGALALLGQAGFDEARSHPEVHRPWGSYRSVVRGDQFQVKIITVKPGGRLSLQLHHHRSEHWVVVKGTALVTCGERTLHLYENQSTYIPRGEIHRLENPGRIPLELIEVQSGSYLGEDDIVRVEDVYGRS